MTGVLKDGKKKNKLARKKVQTVSLKKKKKAKRTTFFWVYPPRRWPVPVLSSISQHPLLVMFAPRLLAPFLTFIQIPAVLKEMSDLASAATWECE